MSRRRQWPPGTPCFVGVICPDDAEPAKAFYSALFGWTYEDISGPDGPPFHIASLQGDRVANVAGSGSGEPGVWITAISVADLADSAAAVNDAGGSAPPDATTEIATIGRFHRVEDSAGMEIHLGQIDGTAVERVDEPGAWSTSTLRVADPSSVATFYEAVFGWRTHPAGSATVFRLAGPEPGDVAVLEPTDADSEVRDGWMPDFRVADLDITLETAAAHGGRVVGEATSDLAGLRTAVLADPGGATFTISQPT